MSEPIISQRKVRQVMRKHCGNMPISKEAIRIVNEYLDNEVTRICECGVKEFLDQNKYRKIPKRRLPGSVFKGVLNT
jgi:hypothetical protein